MKSNKYESALSETQNMNGIHIPETINENEKGYYHIILGKKKVDLINDIISYESRVVKIQREQFGKMKDNYLRHGFHKMIIFHDPTFVAVKESKPVEEKSAINLLKAKANSKKKK